MSLEIKRVIEEGITPIDQKRPKLVEKLTKEAGLTKIPLTNKHLLFLVISSSRQIVFACLLEKSKKGLIFNNDKISILSSSDELPILGPILGPLERFYKIFHKYTLTFCDKDQQAIKVIADHAGDNTIYIISHRDIDYDDIRDLSHNWSNIEYNPNTYNIIKQVIDKGAYDHSIKHLQKLLRKPKVELQESILDYSDNELMNFFKKHGVEEHSEVLKSSLYCFMNLIFFQHESGLNNPFKAEFTVKEVKRGILQLRGPDKSVKWMINEELLRNLQ